MQIFAVNQRVLRVKVFFYSKNETPKILNIHQYVFFSLGAVGGGGGGIFNIVIIICQRPK